MTERVAITLGHAQLELLADRAVYWPAHHLLAIADLHLAKGDTFRSHGIAVPSGGTAHDLQRLDRLLRSTGAQRLLILGDVLHGTWRGEQWRQQWHAFRRLWPQVQLQALSGNHDRRLPGADLALELLGEQWELDGIRFQHEPDDHALPSICGHIHPVVRLPGLGRRTPVFWRRHDRLVLPAFSAFTGGYLLKPQRGEQYYPCNGEMIVEI